jgi:hypothetical protein
VRCFAAGHWRNQESREVLALSIGQLIAQTGRSITQIENRA